MIQKCLLLLPLVALTACNMYGAVDKPKGDPQLLSAARGCLDRGDYTCAKEYYQQLSSSYNDVKLSELSLTAMAEANAFSIRDLIDTLGSDRGGGSTFAAIAETMAARGKTDGATRSLLVSNFLADAQISETNLKGFMQFLTAFATFNQTLSAAVGADGKLTASDLVNDPTGCKAANSTTCGTTAITQCARPTGSPLFNVATDNGQTDPAGSTIASTTNWDTTPSLAKLRSSASSAVTALQSLGNNSYSGLLDVMNQLNNLPDPALSASVASCTRYVILTTLFK